MMFWLIYLYDFRENVVDFIKIYLMLNNKVKKKILYLNQEIEALFVIFINIAILIKSIGEITGETTTVILYCIQVCIFCTSIVPQTL